MGARASLVEGDTGGRETVVTYRANWAIPVQSIFAINCGVNQLSFSVVSTVDSDTPVVVNADYIPSTVGVRWTTKHDSGVRALVGNEVADLCALVGHILSNRSVART